MNHRLLWALGLCVVSACGGGDDHHADGADSGADAATSGDGAPSTKSGCGEGIVDPSTGAIDAAEYRKQARAWDRATIDCRLGPKFTDLHPGAPDARKTAYEPEHKSATDGYLCKTYELSGTCSGSCDYGSTAGQVLYAADANDDPGVDRLQNYAYERGRICESFQQGTYLGGPHPDPALVKWSKDLGRKMQLPNGFAQAELYQTNGGILIFPDGFIGATGNQTSGGSFPHFQLPANKVPTSVFVTGYNEFALVTIWDTDALKGQVAVFALRADSPPAFSVPYFALPNEAGFVGIHLMGYVDLPDMATPTAIAASGNNGSTPGGHAIGNEFANSKDPTQHIATSETARIAFARNDYERWVADSGHAIVASRWEGKLTFLDMRPLYRFVRSVYFGSKDKFNEAARQDSWPYTFENSPEARPLVVTTLNVSKPTALRVGNMVGGFAKGLEKHLHGFVGNIDGEVLLYDLNGFAAETRPVPPESVKLLTKVRAAENITSMRSKERSANDRVLVVGRGDRTIRWIEVTETALVVTRTLEDSRIVDPVVADASDRASVVSVVDFTGRKLLNYRYGPTENHGGKPPATYGCGPMGMDATCADFELGGTFTVPGTPFYYGTTNVN